MSKNFLVTYFFSQQPVHTSLIGLYLLISDCFVSWWAWIDSNYRPHPYQGCALPPELQARTCSCLMSGGAERDRTDDLLSANQALSQLSYSPVFSGPPGIRSTGPTPYIRCSPVFQNCNRGQLEAAVIQEQRHARTVRYRAENGRYGLERLPLTSIGYIFSVTPATFSLRKEVIQPQVLLRLPCYDFTPIMSHTLGRCLPCGLAYRLLVQPTFVM